MKQLKSSNMATFEKAQLIVGVSEGGYQNDTQDEGNWYLGKLIGTNWGISAPTLANYLGRTPSEQDMRSLTKADAEAILKSRYWDRNYLGLIKNQSLATLIYDGCVNQGSSTMRLLVEKALSSLKKPLIFYQVFTLEGIALMNKLSQKELFNAIKTARSNRYKSSPKKKYIKGWLARLDRIDFEEDSFTGFKQSAIPLILLFFGLSFLFLGL